MRNAQHPIGNGSGLKSVTFTTPFAPTRGGRAAARAVCEPLEDGTLLSGTATVAVGSTTTIDSGATSASVVDTHASNGKGQNGYPHGKFGFWP